MSGAWSKLKKTLSFKGFGWSSKQENQRPPSSSSTSSSTTAVVSAIAKSRSSAASASSLSFSTRFSRSFSTSSKRTCAICLGNVRVGRGQAIFTAECSHSFHFSCIANSVKHGNYLCPICRSSWKEIPFAFPDSITGNHIGRARVSPEGYPVHFSRHLLPPAPSPAEPLHFSDDEPLSAVPTNLASSNSVVHSQNVTIKAFPEFPAVAASDSISSFPVLVGIQAPPLLNDDRHLKRAPIDLVTVLDVSGSMAGSKLALLKRAVRFVVDNLGASDRLAIVSFSSAAQRIFPLRRMTERGREDAKRAINLLSSNGGTNIVAGLKKGAQVLEERRERNPVASIILLSDGKDNYNINSTDRSLTSRNQTSPLLNFLPASICPRNRQVSDGRQHLTFPVHTFGFGSDHDSSAMHAISDTSGGTFSFIESVGMVQDAFARCIGGLLSVVVQELKITVRSPSPGVEIGSISSGRYKSEISEQGCVGSVNVGDLYADEEKEFLVYLSVPSFPAIEDEGRVGMTLLLDVRCSYKDTLSREIVHVEGERIGICRPEVISPADMIVSLEVDRQRNRLLVAEGIAVAQEMADNGDLEGAQAVLTNRRSTLLSSASAQAGDALCNSLEAELSEIQIRLANQELYEHTGRAYMLSGLSSHSWQRATTRGDTTTHSILLKEGGSTSTGGAIGYDTPSMVSLVSKSQSVGLPKPSQQVERLNKMRSSTSRRNSISSF